MKKLLFLFMIVFLFSCENKTCKTCTTEITTNGYPDGPPVSITISDIDIPPAPMTITSSNCYYISPLTITFEACGKHLKEVDGKTVTIVLQSYTLTSKTTCK